MDRIIATKVFVNIVDLGSMAAAADALDMSRSMVTRYLSEMEKWAGARLLHRSTRRLSLTNAGDKTLAQCRQILELAENLPSINQHADNVPQGLIRISCSQSLAQCVLTPLITDFLHTYPETKLDLKVSNRATNLVKERIDLAIRITNDLDPNVIAKPLGEVNSVLCATPGYLLKNGNPMTLQQLATHNCLTYSYFGKSLWTFTFENKPQSIPVSGNLSANESMVLLEAALSDSGIALQPLHAVASHLKSGELVQLLPDYSPRKLGIYGIYQSRKNMTVALRCFIDALVNDLADKDL